MGSVYLFNGARYILAGLVVLPFVRLKTPIPRTQYKWMFLAGLLLFTAAAFQQVGIVHTTAGNAGFITSLYVVLVPLVLLVGWREKPHWISIIALATAVIGAYLLSMGGRPSLGLSEGFTPRKGDALELIGAFFWAMHVVLLGKYASKFEPISFSVGQLLVCGLLNLILGLFLEQPVLTWPLAGAAIYTAVLSLGLCYTLQVWAQRHTPPSDAALILSLESVFAVLAGWYILGEQMKGIQYFGCILIFIAVVLSQIKDRRLPGTMEQDCLMEDR